MTFSARLAVTFDLIRWSLFPPSPPDMPLRSPGPSVSPRGVYAALLDPKRNGITEEVSLLVAGAFSPAAIFVLFRLKRWGFSACRVLVESEGLRIVARR